MQKVTIRGHLWYHQYEQKGGDAIDFVRKFYNKDYARAVEMLLNGGGQAITSPIIEKEHKPFKLPQKNDRMSRLFLICCLLVVLIKMCFMNLCVER